MSKKELTPFEKMQSLATKVVSVPKEEIDRREEERKKVKTRLSEKSGEGRAING